jgi:GntR family transcriptional regulator, transcriptional repressor for pyruvate dehydrogenase complex
MSVGELRPIEKNRADTAAAKVARNLIEYLVVSRGVSLGERIPSERQLAEVLGTGRSAVREALKALNILGLVDIRQGGGTYLTSAESTLLPDVIEWGLLLGGERTRETIEARLVIECALAGFAARRRTDEQLLRLDSLLADMAATVDQPERFTDADVAFHMELARAAHNATLASVHSSLQSMLRVWIKKVLSHYDRSREALVDEHRRVLEAVRAKNPAGAEAAMREHLEAAGQRLGEALHEKK